MNKTYIVTRLHKAIMYLTQKKQKPKELFLKDTHIEAIHKHFDDAVYQMKIDDKLRAERRKRDICFMGVEIRRMQ